MSSEPAAALPASRIKVLDAAGEVTWFAGAGRLVCVVKDGPRYVLYQDTGEDGYAALAASGQYDMACTMARLAVGERAEK